MPITKKKCQEIYGACYDFAAEFADVSVGSIGSEFGWSTVITRSDAGKALVKRAEEEGEIETKKQGNLKNIYKKAEPIRILNMQVDPEMLESFLGGE